MLSLWKDCEQTVVGVMDRVCVQLNSCTQAPVFALQGVNNQVISTQFIHNSTANTDNKSTAQNSDITDVNFDLHTQSTGLTITTTTFIKTISSGGERTLK